MPKGVHKPKFLEQLEAFLQKELRSLDCAEMVPSEKRLQVSLMLILLDLKVSSCNFSHKVVAWGGGGGVGWGTEPVPLPGPFAPGSHPRPQCTLPPCAFLVQNITQQYFLNFSWFPPLPHDPHPSWPVPLLPSRSSQVPAPCPSTLPSALR